MLQTVLPFEKGGHFLIEWGRECMEFDRTIWRGRKTIVQTYKRCGPPQNHCAPGECSHRKVWSMVWHHRGKIGSFPNPSLCVSTTHERIDICPRLTDNADFLHRSRNRTQHQRHSSKHQRQQGSSNQDAIQGKGTDANPNPTNALFFPRGFSSAWGWAW